MEGGEERLRHKAALSLLEGENPTKRCTAPREPSEECWLRVVLGTVPVLGWEMESGYGALGGVLGGAEPPRPLHVGCLNPAGTVMCMESST